MRMTERYAHDDADPLERGAARVARRIATSLAREPDAERTRHAKLRRS